MLQPQCITKHATELVNFFVYNNHNVSSIEYGKMSYFLGGYQLSNHNVMPQGEMKCLHVESCLTQSIPRGNLLDTVDSVSQKENHVKLCVVNAFVT